MKLAVKDYALIQAESDIDGVIDSRDIEKALKHECSLRDVEFLRWGLIVTQRVDYHPEVKIRVEYFTEDNDLGIFDIDL